MKKILLIALYAILLIITFPFGFFVLVVMWRIKKAEKKRGKLSEEERSKKDKQLLNNTGNFLTAILPTVVLITFKNLFGWPVAILLSVIVFITGRLTFSFIQKRWER